MKVKGFTLIEAMLVIGIIAILSVVGSAAWREYKAKAQIASVIPVIDQIKNNAIEYYSINGVFPDASHLGYDSDVPGELSDPTVISPMLTSVSILSTAYNDIGYTCTSNFGEMYFIFDSTQVAAGDGLFDFGVYIYYADVDGVVTTTADDDSDENKYVPSLVNPTYPDYDSLFLAAGCTMN